MHKRKWSAGSDQPYSLNSSRLVSLHDSGTIRSQEAVPSGAVHLSSFAHTWKQCRGRNEHLFIFQHATKTAVRDGFIHSWLLYSLFVSWSCVCVCLVQGSAKFRTEDLVFIQRAELELERDWTGFSYRMLNWKEAGRFHSVTQQRDCIINYILYIYSSVL